MSSIGDNSGATGDPFAVSESQLKAANVAADDLLAGIERIERLEAEKKGIGDDIKDIYNELKAKGYDAKIMRQIVRLRKQKPDDRREMEAVLATYKTALGMD